MATLFDALVKAVKALLPKPILYLAVDELKLSNAFFPIPILWPPS